MEGQSEHVAYKETQKKDVEHITIKVVCSDDEISFEQAMANMLKYTFMSDCCEDAYIHEHQT